MHPHRHVRLVIRPLEGPLLSRGPAGRRVPPVLRRASSHGGDQQQFLPAARGTHACAVAGFRAGLLRVRRQGEWLHYAQEEASGPAGDPSPLLRKDRRAGGQTRPRTLPAPPEVALRPGTACGVPWRAEPGCPVRLRVPRPELVHPRSAGRTRPPPRRVLHLRTGGQAFPRGGHGRLRLRPAPRAGGPLPGALRRRDARLVGREVPRLGRAGEAGPLLFRQRPGGIRGPKRPSAPGDPVPELIFRPQGKTSSPGRGVPGLTRRAPPGRPSPPPSSPPASRRLRPGEGGSARSPGSPRAARTKRPRRRGGWSSPPPPPSPPRGSARRPLPRRATSLPVNSSAPRCPPPSARRRPSKRRRPRPP